MALPDLTGQNIENTYQRVLQTDGTIIYDGTGSVFLPVSASYSVTASYAEYAVSASHEIIKEVSSSYADYAKESGLSTSSISASYALTASYALNSPDTFPYTGSAIISGSLTVTGSTKTQYLTASGLNYPTIDGDEKQLITTDGSGNLFFDWSDRTNLDVKNTSGVSLSAGTPVYLTGFQGASIFQIAAASSSISSTMPAIGVLDTDLNPNDQGHATLIGAVRNIDTSTPGYSINQSLYVGEGVLTPNRPTGSAQIQKIARVGKVANNGEITILGAGRTNDIPNLQPGYAWVGDSTWNAVATPTSSFNEDPFPYTGSAIISGSLEVTGSIVTTDNITIPRGKSLTFPSSPTQAGGISIGDNFSTSSPGTNFVRIGNSAGYEANANKFIAIGDEAGRSSSGQQQIFIGFRAGRGFDNSNNVVVIGHFAAWGDYSNADVDNAVILGTNAGQAVTQTDNIVIIGTNAGYNTEYSSKSVIIGDQAGYNHSGSSGDTKEGNVFLGYQAGYNELGSNKLIIANTGSEALVTGDFANNTFNISGSVSASTYYGDGSNLTGIETDPFPYTGSAVISGDLSINGFPSVSSSLALATTNVFDYARAIMGSDVLQGGASQQNFDSATAQKVKFNTSADTEGTNITIDTTNNRITVGATGYYVITSNISFYSGGARTTPAATFKVNGTTGLLGEGYGYIRAASGQNDNNNLITCVVELQQNDYVEVFVGDTSTVGGALYATQAFFEVSSTGGGYTGQTGEQGIQGPSGTSYDVVEITGDTTLSNVHTTKYLVCNSATAIDITVPQTASYDQYAEFVFEQRGAGIITVVADTGVTINSTETLKSSGQYSVIGLKRTDSNMYTLTGEREVTP